MKEHLNKALRQRWLANIRFTLKIYKQRIWGALKLGARHYSSRVTELCQIPDFHYSQLCSPPTPALPPEVYLAADTPMCHKHVETPKGTLFYKLGLLQHECASTSVCARECIRGIACWVCLHEWVRARMCTQVCICKSAWLVCSTSVCVPVSVH